MCGITGHETTRKNTGSRDRRKSEFPEMESDKTMRSLIYCNQQPHVPKVGHSSGAQTSGCTDSTGYFGLLLEILE